MLIKQRSNYDCALAVLAMASGKQYEEIFDAEFCARIEEKQTCTGDDLLEAYRRAGFVKGENLRTISTAHAMPHLPLQLIWGRRAMIQVPSLNYKGSEHFVYWDGKEILDPSNKQVYRYLQNIVPTYIIVFDEAGA